MRKLVSRAEDNKLVLVSLMAKLHCKTFAEKLMIPAFVFFFDMLFPFALVNRPRNQTAAAAGGCMLVKREALERAGNIDAIKHEIIDDCALGRAMKKQGPIWLGLTNRAVSIRPYEGLSEIRRMIARSAYAQLDYSPLQLVGTVLGMSLLFIAPPAAAIFATGLAQIAGALAWAAMVIAFAPMLRFYKLSPLWAAMLPVIGVALHSLHFRLRDPVLARPRRHVEGQGTGDPRMTTATDLASGKGHTDENFPVASCLDPSASPPGDPRILSFCPRRR